MERTGDNSMRKVLKTISAALLIAMLLSMGLIGNESVQARSAPFSGRLTGVNWFGFETGNCCVHGIWARDYKSVLKQIKDLGFNCVRIPWCNAIFTAKPNSVQINASGVDPYTKEKGLNLDLEGLDAMGILDKIIAEAGRLGLYIVLDNHSREPDGYMVETLWYTAKTSEAKWISDWKLMAERYKNYDNVVGYDLNNEPHGNMTQGMKPPATWGYNQEGYENTDWKAAAEKCGLEILKINPSAVIIIEGVENYKGENYWWGGNLKGVKDSPVNIPKANLMYSPHEYGPEVYNQSWFSDPSFPNNMAKIWDDNFWFIYKQNIAPIFVGEFGIKGDSAGDPSSVPYKWLKTFMEYAGKNCSWTFWCMNPNSGDTGGILEADWVTANMNKVNLLKPYMAPQGPSVEPPSSSSKPTTPPEVSPSPTPTITPIKTPTPTTTKVPTPTPTATVIPTNGGEPGYDFDVVTTFSSQRLVSNQMITAKMQATNVSAKPYTGNKDVLLIVGLYNANNTMVNVSYISKGIPYRGNDILSAGFKLPSNVDGYSVKAFMWDGTDLSDTNMTPISNEQHMP